MATGQSARQSTVTVLIGAMRLAAIAVAGLLPGQLTLDQWAWWHAGASGLAAVACLGMTFRDHGAPSWGWPWRVWIGGQLGEGLTFAAEGALQASVKDLDKPIVLEFAGAHAAGVYAAAFRIIDTIALPVRALGYAVVARLFRLAAEDRAACIAYGLKLLPIGLGIGLAAGLGVLLAADLLPVIFGPAYAELPFLVRLICLMPAAFAVYIVGADVLSATGRQSRRLGVVVVSLTLTLALCWLTLPSAGIAGAAASRVAVMAVTAGLVWVLVLRRR
jgi:O-antigen/teichoic acid export membrane protein